MKIKIYHVDAFADKLFSGNPAAVCPLPAGWLPVKTMQNIAMENNLSETAFCILGNNIYHIRWFTPVAEVDLCGHATLATAYVLFFHEKYGRARIEFSSRSGFLAVEKERQYMAMDFPADVIHRIKPSRELLDCFDIKPLEVFKGGSDHMLVFKNEKDITDIGYDLDKMRRINGRGIIITARGRKSDFVSRFFAPKLGVNEDPVTGSAHTTLAPYWSRVLDKKELTAIQLSKRGGVLICRNNDKRVEILGKAKTFSEGTITI